ncbi:MAG TPA: hypothetical protein ENN07_02650 [candidate division Zixibacteria bacterium]|nr:hypothetical protein [candidate division Zixibacteria bacterium]
MKYPLLTDKDMKAMDALKEHHGGAKKIVATIEEMRDFGKRKAILAEKGYGKMIEEAEQLVKEFPQVDDWVKANGIEYNPDLGTGTSQVSGFQGAKVTHNAMKRIAATAGTDEPCWAPQEMISVVALTDNYVYNGDLMATLTMAENIMKASKFCSTNLIGIPQPEDRFRQLEAVTGEKFERYECGCDVCAISLKNQGTVFGNFGGIEVANNNHLIYLDGITRTALATGNNFFLNPSWSTIVAICYYGRDIPNLHIKVSMLLSTQNPMQFRMLLNIMNEYLREDGTSPIYEINIGNGSTATNFIQCARELKESRIKGVSLAAHIYINPDLGAANFNWTDEMWKVLDSGTDMTFKYESDGTAHELDTMATYFVSEEERDAMAEDIGEVIFNKSLRASKDGRLMMKRGSRAIFAESSQARPKCCCCG